MITKADKFIIYGITVTALIVALVSTAYSRTLSNGAEVVISRNGREIASYPLGSKKGKVKVIGPLGESVIELSATRARMLDSPCPKKICCAQGWIEKPNRTIVCVPNRVVIKVVPASAKKKDTFDAISR